MSEQPGKTHHERITRGHTAHVVTGQTGRVETGVPSLATLETSGILASRKRREALRVTRTECEGPDYYNPLEMQEAAPRRAGRV